MIRKENRNPWVIGSVNLERIATSYLDKQLPAQLFKIQAS